MSIQEKSTPKSSDVFGLKFLLVELFVFFSQVLVIFLVTFFISDMFQSEPRLVEFINGKLNLHSITELMLTLGAIVFVMGMLCISKEIIPFVLVEEIASEVLYELPRTIYLFGSSITAVTFALAFFLSKHPEATEKPEGYYAASFLFASSFFAFGIFTKILLSNKRIRRSKLENQ